MVFINKKSAYERIFLLLIFIIVNQKNIVLSYQKQLS